MSHQLRSEARARSEARTRSEVRALTRDLVMRYGWNATAYQLLNPGMKLWFSQHSEAVVGYVSWRRVWVVAGAPVCEEAQLERVVAEFEAAAARRDRGVCYFGAAGRLKHLLDGNPAYSSVVLGAQPVWHPRDWGHIIDGQASLRAQLNRARNKGIVVREWPAEQAQRNPMLCRILREWLQTRGLPPLHFLVEPRTLDNIGDRRLWVAEDTRKANSPVAFLNMAPVPQRHGWLTEQFVRGHAAPNGTIELLMDTAIRALAADGAQYVTMGLVPLSHQGSNLQDNPLWLRLLLAWIRAHGRRFYNFEGLEKFKAKFQPELWEPIWAVSREPHFSPSTLWAIAGAFSCQPPPRLLLRGLMKAARQEWKWLQANGINGFETRLAPAQSAALQDRFHES